MRRKCLTKPHQTLDVLVSILVLIPSNDEADGQESHDYDNAHNVDCQQDGLGGRALQGEGRGGLENNDRRQLRNWKRAGGLGMKRLDGETKM